MAWHCNGLHYNASHYISIAIDVSKWQLVGWFFTREFLFQGFCGHTVTVTEYKGMLYQGTTVHKVYFRKHTVHHNYDAITSAVLYADCTINWWQLMKVHRHDVSSWVVWTASGQLIVKLCSG
jgi:hypothetical protein